MRNFARFGLILLSERGESYKTNANEVSYEASFKAPLTRKTRLEQFNISSVVEFQRWWVLKSKIFAMW